MQPRSRLPRKTACLSSCSRSWSRARLPTSCAAKGTLRLSADDPGQPPRSSRKPREPGRDLLNLPRAGGSRPNKEPLAEGAMATPDFDLHDIKGPMGGRVTFLKTGVGGLRPGRASAGLVDHVQVEA